MQYFQIIIVGAGPAGAACALALANSGLQVAIVDKSIFPRDKTCGDAIPGNALKVLQKVMPSALQDLENYELKNKITQSTVITANGKSISMQWVGKAYNASRLSWDNFLMQQVKTKTPTTIFEDYFVKSVMHRNDVWTISNTQNLQLQCTLLICADGALAGVSRLLPNNNLNYKNTAVAVRQYYSNINLSSTQNIFVLNKQFTNSYFWIFPVENNLYNVGFGVVNPVTNGKTLDVKKAFAQLIATDKNLQTYFTNAKPVDEISGFKLPLYSKQQSISGQAYLLCGDAAHLIDPLQGHGIDKAMQSGMLAALHAIESFKQNNCTANFNKSYDTQVYATMGKELQRNNMIMGLLSKWPVLADVVANLFGIKVVKRLAAKWS